MVIEALKVLGEVGVPGFVSLTYANLYPVIFIAPVPRLDISYTLLATRSQLGIGSVSPSVAEINCISVIFSTGISDLREK